MRIRYHSANPIRILQETYLYAGGAHGNYFSWPLNLTVAADGRVREFALADTFVTGAAACVTSVR